ncbi:APC family permease [Trinickia terrae]|uniref:APC family permease n=1 Tax=Trinickia terrae TaxID=2571161 RepID=UPI00146EF0E8|nr:APC family permease [Trinickia terrae]
MKRFSELIRLVAIAIGMAVSITCNTVLASLFAYVDIPAFYVSLVVAGVAMIVIVLCFAELSSKFPGAIGIRAFTKAAFGNRFSLAVTLFYICMVMLMGGLEIFLCHLLLRQLLPGTWAIGLLVFLLASIVVVNLRGYELSMRFQIVMALLVVCMMIGLSMMGMNPDAVSQPARSHSDWLHSVPSALFLFVGVEWAVMHVTRHDAFKRTLPQALVVSVLLTGALYGLLGSALGSQFSIDQIPLLKLPHLELAKKTHAQSAILVVTLLSLFAMLTNFNVGLSGAARMLYSLAREGEIPVWFAKLQGKSLAPQNAILFISASVIAAVPIMASDALSGYISLLLGLHLCIVYGFVLVAWLQLRRKKDRRGIQLPISRYVVTPVFLLLAVIVVGAFVDVGSSAVKLILLAEGLVISAICINPFSRPISIKTPK